MLFFKKYWNLVGTEFFPSFFFMAEALQTQRVKPKQFKFGVSGKSV